MKFHKIFRWFFHVFHCEVGKDLFKLYNNKSSILFLHTLLLLLLFCCSINQQNNEVGVIHNLNNKVKLASDSLHFEEKKDRLKLSG